MTQAEKSDGTLAESWFRSIVEAAPHALIVIDERHAITFLNPSAEALLGYGRAELVGKDIEPLIPGCFQDPPPRELVGRRKDGCQIALEIERKPLADPGGFSLLSLGDISARQVEERSRLAVESELRRSNEELEQFAYTAAHDLQEPLRMVASYMDLLTQRYQGKLDERADKYIFYAVDGANRMQRLLADLLLYARVSSQGKPLAPVSADAVVGAVLDTLGGAIRRAKARVTVGPLPRVLADRGQLTLLFQSLIGNALKFQGAAPPLVEIGASRVDDRWQFSVKDNGIGIDHQHRDRIFQMFQRLHERGKYDGSGSGLAIAKRICERHGGRIWLESEPGHGSTFFFTLRAADSWGEL